MDKLVASPAAAVADIRDDASIGIAGFGVAHRFPSSLITALREQGTHGLTVYCNGLGQPASRRPTCSRTAIRSATW
jgi:3-oxoacid CoA-transferase